MDVRDKREPSKSQVAAALVAVFAAAFLTGLGAQSALAGTAQSDTGYYTAGGTQFKNAAIIATAPGQAQALTVTERSSGSTPAGWAGSRGRLFTSAGALSCEGTTTYNTAGNQAHGASCSRSTHGTWYSYGVSEAWNGSGYNPFYTFLSPNQNS